MAFGRVVELKTVRVCMHCWRVAQRVIDDDGWTMVSFCSGGGGCVLGAFWVLGSGSEVWCYWPYYYEQVWVAGVGESGPMRVVGGGVDLALGFPIMGLTLCFFCLVRRDGYGIVCHHLSRVYTLWLSSRRDGVQELGAGCE